jgi:hypothetical protein
VIVHSLCSERNCLNLFFSFNVILLGAHVPYEHLFKISALSLAKTSKLNLYLGISGHSHYTSTSSQLMVHAIYAVKGVDRPLPTS